MQVNEQNRNIQASARLCEAIKWHPCLYDSKSKVYQMKHAVEAAWRSIANECEDTVVNCKFRWRVIRNSFAISFRKHGVKNKHYLQEYLDFLVPHVSSIAAHADSLKKSENTDVIELEVELEEDDDDDEEVEDEDEHEHDDEEEFDHDEEADEEANKTQNPHTDGHESETSSAEETIKEKSAAAAEKVADRRRKLAAKAEDTHEDEDGEEHHAGSQTDDGPARGRRIVRMRRATKRYLESGLYEGRKKDRSEEKRPRLSAERKKSIPSPAMDEYDKRKSVGSLPSKRVEVKLSKTKLNETAPVEPKKFKSELAIKQALAEKARAALNKVEKPSLTKEPIGKSFSTTDNNTAAVVETKTTATDTITKKCVNRATQCDNELPKTLDEQFLETIKPQMELMNSRQKFSFKKKVFQALMDVFDDATNFPNKDEVVDLPATGAPRFDSTTVGELRLMRELVHLVQAAKLTPEIMNATEKVDDSSTSTPPAVADKAEKNASVTTMVVSNERKSNSPNMGISKRNETLGLPRHILQKVVKVAGSNGGTILAHEGEKRRVYRIYPKGTLPPSVVNTVASTSSASIGTFYVTPPKSTTASSSSNQTKTSAQAGNSAQNGKPITFNGKVVNHFNTNTLSSLPSLPPPLQPNPNPKNVNANVVTRHKISVRTPSGGLAQNRVGGAVNSGAIPALQNKNISSTNAAKSTSNMRASWDDPEKSLPSPGLAQIQISQPISLNAAANSVAASGVKAYLESAGGDSAAAAAAAAGDTSPNTILPDAGMVDDEDGTAGTITSDGYDPLFIKSLIKDEPSE